MLQTPFSSPRTPYQMYQILRDNIGINTGELTLKTLGLIGTAPYLPLLDVSTSLAQQYAKLKKNVAVVETAYFPQATTPSRGLMDVCRELIQTDLHRGKISNYGFWDILALTIWQNKTCRVHLNSGTKTIAVDFVEGHIAGLMSSERVFEKMLIKNLMRLNIVSVKTLQTELGQKRFDPYTLLCSLRQIVSLDPKSFRLLYEKSLREAMLHAGSASHHDFFVAPPVITELPLLPLWPGETVAFRNLLEPAGLIRRTLTPVARQEAKVTVYPWGNTPDKAENAENLLVKLMPLISMQHDFLVLSLPHSPKHIHPVFLKMLDAALIVVPEIMSDISGLGALSNRLGRHTRVLGNVIATSSLFH